MEQLLTEHLVAPARIGLRCQGSYRVMPQPVLAIGRFPPPDCKHNRTRNTKSVLDFLKRRFVFDRKL